SKATRPLNPSTWVQPQPLAATCRGPLVVLPAAFVPPEPPPFRLWPPVVEVPLTPLVPAEPVPPWVPLVLVPEETTQVPLTQEKPLLQACPAWAQASWQRPFTQMEPWAQKTLKQGSMTQTPASHWPPAGHCTSEQVSTQLPPWQVCPGPQLTPRQSLSTQVPA